MFSHADSRTLERIGRNLTALRMDAALLGLHVAAKAGFNPNQPRVPAGNPDGGRWTRIGAVRPNAGTGPVQTTPQAVDLAVEAPRRTVVRDESGEEAWEAVVTAQRSDGSIAEQNVINRDGSHIRSEFSSTGADAGFDSRHTVVGPDGTSVTFENIGPRQLIYDGTGELLTQASWEPGGPRTEVYRPDLLAPDIVDDGGVEDAVAGVLLLPLGLGLYNWLTSTDDAGQHTVASFSAREFVRGAGQTSLLDSVRTLTEEEVNNTCKAYADVQGYTNKAVATVMSKNVLGLSPQVFGTAVHTELKRIVLVEAPELRAEVSFLKTLEEAGEAPDPSIIGTRYGRRGSIRVDVLEDEGSGLVCVYDIKTGAAELRMPRAAELAQTVRLYYPHADRFIAIEVKPTQ